MQIAIRIHRFLSKLVVLSMILSLLPPSLLAAASQSGPTSPGTVDNLSATRTYRQSAVAMEPDALAAPISLSRVQSAYTAGTRVFTFTLTNNLLPTLLPDVPDTAPITDTLDILAGFSLTADANTLRNGTLVDTLNPGVVFLDASGTYNLSGPTVTWSLEDLPPQTSAVITMAVQTPSAGADFVEIDGGAELVVDRWGEILSITAVPALLTPASLDASLTSATPDADLYDAEMLWKSASFNQDPLAMFAYVQTFGFDPYKGSLRGTRGALWGEAANAVDRSSLLIAMLRAAGIPARYRHGALSNSTAVTLLAGAFPQAAGRAGSLPAGTAIADPLNDPDLLALVADHWWVEAYLPGSGWTDLDSSFPSANPGDVFVASIATDGTDRIAALPANQQHTISVRLKVEQYSTFPVGGSNLVESYPLETTFPTAQLAGKRLTFAHLVTSDLQGGVFSNVIHTYTPYFAIEENGIAYQGDPFQDFLSNFPLSSEFTTAEWIEYEITDPDGNSESFSRTVKDLIGADTRLSGGALDLAVDLNSPPFALLDDLYVNWVLPHHVTDWAHSRWTLGLLPRMVEIAQHGQEMLVLASGVAPGQALSPEQTAAFSGARTQIILSSERLLTDIGLDFAWAADQTLKNIESGMQTRLFYDSPRVFTVASVGDPLVAVTTTVDLRRTAAQAIVYPGQAEAAAFSAQWVKGLAESYLEGQVLETVEGQPALTTWRVFDQMLSQGIVPVLLTPQDLDQLDIYPFSSLAQAHVATALAVGKSVLIPTEPVDVDGEDVFAWWEVDPSTGETVSVGEDGLHTAALSYRILVLILEAGIDLYGAGSNPLSGPGPSDVAESAKIIGEKLNNKFLNLLETWESATSRQLDPGDAILGFGESAWRAQPAHRCPIENCGVEQFFIAGLGAADIPLPEVAFVYGPGWQDHPVARSTVPVVGTLPGGTPAFSLAVAPAASSTTPDAPVNFQAEISANYDDDFIVMAYAPAGWAVTLDSGGSVDVQPAAGAAPDDYTVQVVAQSLLYPDLVAAAQHVVTVQALEAMDLSLGIEPDITVPMGAAQLQAVSNQTNDGEAEIPGAAYTLVLSNTATTAHTYNVSVSGPPAGWVILNGTVQTSASVDLGPGETAALGLYLQPPPGTVPASGTSYPVSVTAAAVDNPTLTDSAGAVFNMPGQAFNYITTDPTTLFVESNGSVDFDLEVENVGNASGTFPITTYSPVSGMTVSGLPGSVNLGIGSSTTAQGTLDVSGLTPGIRFPLEIASPAPGSYTQYALAEVQVISALTGPVFNAAEHIGVYCPLGEPGLSAALESLGYAMVQLENACGSGGCALSLRDRVVEAVETTAFYAGSISSLVTAVDTLSGLAADLASHTDDAAILADLAAISSTVTDLELEVCELSEHFLALTWTPGYDAILPGGTAVYTLTLTNLGSVTTPYTLNVDLPAGAQTLTPTVAPGVSVDFVYPVSESTLGLYDLSAVAEAAGPEVALPGLSVEAAARLSVVDRFLQLTAVRPDPAFVETGTSATTIHIDVSNVANLGWEATAQTTIQDPAGGVNFSMDYPVNLLLGAPRSYTLGTVDTSGWPAGVYTVSVELLDTNLDLIPDGEGYGYLGVGQGLGVSHNVSPAIVAPGTVTVTTQITTELLSESIVPMRGSGEMVSGRVDESTNQGVDELANQSIDEALVPERTAESVESLILTTWAITRTEDTSPAIVYSGTWATQTNPQFSDSASNADYTYSSIAGDTASFDFTGTWVHVGFIASQESGEAEILIDGISQGNVDLYGPTFNSAADVASFIFDGLPDTAHTLTIRVAGTSNPFANGQLVKLDYVDTWDGTLLPDGTFEEDHTRVWYSDDWDFLSSPVASGGGFAQKAFQGNPTAWFPFTGDSFSYQVLADNSGGPMRLLVDGQPLVTLDLYSTDPVTRTYSFNGFGAGPHVLTLRHFLNDVTIDAFTTPGAPPYYQDPVYTGVVRYEEYHPAVRYSGADYFHRPRTWSYSGTGGTSGLGDINSSINGDAVSLMFDGRWVSIGVRAGSNRGQAEVFVDGISQGIIGLYEPSETLTSFQFGTFLTGTHTLTMTVLGQPDPPSSGSSIYLDYIDIWDGTVMPDDFTNVQRSEPSGRLHYSSGGVDVDDGNAYEGDYLATTLPNNNVNVWYAFTGDSFTYLAFSRTSGGISEVYLDDVLVDTVSHAYPFSQQPISHHYTGFGDGPHVARVKNINSMRVDAFASNPESLATFQPLVEWYDNTSGGGSIWGGLHIPVAVGDVTGDGEVELVVASSDINNSGTLFLMRGDGEDTGDGDPIIWSIPYNIFNGFEDVAAPAIAELDGQPGSEIVHATVEGLYVYHSDGSTYWMTDTLHSHVFFASPAVGNLDLNPEPEIAINLSDSLAVFEHDGTLAWSRPTSGTPSMPLLADLTGDGLLDILFQDGDTLYLYDYNNGSPLLAWSQSFATPLGVYGAGAVADIDGQQPGGDPGPEIAISSDGWTHVLDADGSFLWSTPLDPGNPGGVSVADLDGDGEVELVTTMLYNGGRIYALNADGSLLWDVEALDNSSLTASVMDLDGDGIYEVAWNGATGGFTLFNGADGTVLFNEPHPDVVSQTGSDYPVFADVDLDGYAEIVVASQRGVRVFGFDTVWGPARPLWNQHSYHITNINDDLSVPGNELNSWEIHNTYRTQTPLTNPLPSHDVVLTHTVGLTGVMALPGTFNVAPDLDADPVYGWSYTQEAGDPVVIRSFQSRLEELLPGETRLAALGTEVFYTLPGGSNLLSLPGLYVSAPHLVSLDPYARAVGSGAAAAYTVTLTNPAPSSSLYTLAVAGLPLDWVTAPSPVNVPGGSSVGVGLTVNVPPGAAAADYAFSVGVTTDQGGADQASGLLEVLGPLAALQITPAEQAAAAGEIVTFTLTITNFDVADRTYTLTDTGLAEVDLPAAIAVSASGVTSVDFSVEAGGPGPNPFTIRAISAVSAAEDTAVLNAAGLSLVDVAIQPDPAPGGPGSQTAFGVTVTNLGTEAETYDLNVTVPNGWAYALTRNGAPVTAVTLLPAIFNAVELQLVVTPDAAAVQGDYPVTVLAESQPDPLNEADAPISTGAGTATLQVGPRGVLTEILSGPAVLAPSGTGAWQIQVTNTGSLADTYDLTAFGFLGPFAQFSPGIVSLDPGQSQMVQMTASGFLHALARDYTFGVLAQSQADGAVQSEAMSSVTISSAEAVSVVWRPAAQQVTGTLSAAFTLEVTNLGNASTAYQFYGSANPAAIMLFSLPGLPIPARTTVSLDVAVSVPAEGIYQLTGTASGPTAQDSAFATLTVGEVNRVLYLPLIQKY